MVAAVALVLLMLATVAMFEVSVNNRHPHHAPPGADPVGMEPVPETPDVPKP